LPPCRVLAERGGSRDDDGGGCGSDSDYSMKKLRFGRNCRFVKEAM